jgi:hypothetical protein
MAKITTRKKIRTTDSRTGCVTTRCCVECPRPSRRRRRRQVASKSLPLSRAMPMPLPSLQNIMPSPFMPLNIPIPIVEANRRPHGIYQKNNQPFRTQQKSTRSISTMTDTMVRGTTNQKLPITNAPSTLPKPRLTNPFLPAGGSPGRKIFANLPNTLDLQGMNALGVANQGQNLRQNPGVKVAREELLRQSSFDEGESVSGSSDGTPTPRLQERIREKYGTDTQRLATDIETKIGMNIVPATKEARRVLGQQSQSISEIAKYRQYTTMTMGDFPMESSDGAGARMASDTTTDISN